MSELKKIAILMPPALVNSAKTIRGICDYARPGREWTFRFGRGATNARDAQEWGADGIITYVQTQQELDELMTLGIPTVAVTERARHPRAACVSYDNKEAGRLAAQHLLQRGFENFAFAASANNVVSDLRLKGFRQELDMKGRDCAVGILDDATVLSGIPKPWAELDQQATEWLRSLPQPVGVLAWRDLTAQGLTEACIQADLRVPTDVAIVGIDNDETFCEMGTPTISSVEMPFRQVGHRAAKILELMMLEGEPPERPTLIKPRCVISRQSTDIVAVEDDAIATAMEFIRDHASEPISVREVLQATKVSRRSLENRFKRVTGNTPLEEIHRVRVELGKQYLARTDMTVSDVATSSGFRSAKRFSAVFQKLTGLKPSEYRQQSR
ncbi:MAG: substrate-binding domain-containing protein [Phycisphaerae bacterium]